MPPTNLYVLERFFTLHNDDDFFERIFDGHGVPIADDPTEFDDRLHLGHGGFDPGIDQRLIGRRERQKVDRPQIQRLRKANEEMRQWSVRKL